ncbi:MAG TPA: GNAT family N-acetyltransferase [Candidatus Limnocylindria bacterium]|nr:GNAT family N-acetyltransferase [Candidatus Limnocylindria bacterium]
MSEIRIVDVTDEAGFARIPRCADPGFDHRTCDYWEDDRRGSKAARLAWLEPTPPATPEPARAANPFAPTAAPKVNPFDPRAAARSAGNPFDPFGGDDDQPLENPFAPKRDRGPAVAADAPRKVQLLGRGLAVFGSYAKVLEADGEPAAYCQFGPLSAYPRAQHVRDLYPKLPSSPLPAVITCIATTTAARGQGLAKALVLAVVEDLAGRGFSAVEAYPEPEARPDSTSAAYPAFWQACGFDLAIDDPRFPVVRREL